MPPPGANDPLSFGRKDYSSWRQVIKVNSNFTIEVETVLCFFAKYTCKVVIGYYLIVLVHPINST
jgi:hypothetical protein